MAEGAKIKRTLMLKFTAPSADPKQLLALVQAAKPSHGCKRSTIMR